MTVEYAFAAFVGILIGLPFCRLVDGFFAWRKSTRGIVRLREMYQ